jgi:hypothetical protein
VFHRVPLLVPRVEPRLPPRRPGNGPLGGVEEQFADLVGFESHRALGGANDPGRERLQRIDVATHGGVVDAGEEAEERVRGVGAVVEREDEQAVGEEEFVLGSGTGFAPARATSLAAGFGPFAAGREFGQDWSKAAGVIPVSWRNVFGVRFRRSVRLIPRM